MRMIIIKSHVLQESTDINVRKDTIETNRGCRRIEYTMNQNTHRHCFIEDTMNQNADIGSKAL